MKGTPSEGLEGQHSQATSCGDVTNERKSRISKGGPLLKLSLLLPAMCLRTVDLAS
jgi:hypothetical protein